MNPLLSLLDTIPEYRTLLDTLRRGESAAVTGVGQINRSHLLAGLSQAAERPLVILCQDAMAA